MGQIIWNPSLIQPSNGHVDQTIQLCSTGGDQNKNSNWTLGKGFKNAAVCKQRRTKLCNKVNEVENRFFVQSTYIFIVCNFAAQKLFGTV